MNLTVAENLAKQLMTDNGLDTWIFRFDKSVRRFGATHYSLRCITLSKRLTALNDEGQVTNVILHEIAHALAGKGNGHNYAWRYTAQSIGCDGSRCYGYIS